jgi:LCP family protein required for cell wall assembly
MGRHIVRRSRRGRQPLDLDSIPRAAVDDARSEDLIQVADSPLENLFDRDARTRQEAADENAVGGVGAHLAAEAVARREARHATEEDGEELPSGPIEGATARERVASRRRAKKSRPALRAILAALGIIAALAVIGALGAFAYLRGVQGETQDKSAATLQALTQKSRTPGPPVNILVTGSDIRKFEIKRGETKSRADTIMLIRIDPKQKKIWALSFPRDLRVDIPGYGTDKINAANFYGGPPLLIKTINELTGLPIHDYIEVNFEGFKELVDAIGGVWVNVDSEIHDIKAANHDDTAKDIKPGYQKLDGKHALTFVRSRAFPEGDFKRIANQQKFMDALLAQTVRFQNVFRIPQMVQVFSKNVVTSMSLQDMLNMALDLKGVKKKDLYKARIMGKDAKINGIYFYLPDEEQMAVATQRMRNGEPFSGPATGGSIPNEQISITVRNGSGVVGRGRSMGDRLGAMSFDVADVGNAEQSNYVSTLVVYKSNTQAEALQVIRSLGLGKLLPATDKYKFSSDVMVIVGQDYVPAGGGAAAPTANADATN